MSQKRVQTKLEKLWSSSKVENASLVFDSEIELMSVKDFCKSFGFSKATVYDWKYRSKAYEIPDELFIKIGKKLFLRTDIFRRWVSSSAPSLEGLKWRITSYVSS